MDKKREAWNDALKYAKAEMDYGKGAGVNRRHLKAKLESKFEDPIYKEEFDKALDQIDYRAVIRDIRIKKEADRLKDRARITIKAVIIVGGFIYSVYAKNKQDADEAIRRATNRINIKQRNKDAQARAKAMSFLNRKPYTLSDQEKARLYLASKGIKWEPGA